MKNSKMQARLSAEVLEFINSRKSLLLATVCPDGTPYASYAPFAIGDECLYLLLSEIAVHATNLQQTPQASVLIIEDEDSASELFARVRVNYTMEAEFIDFKQPAWQQGIDTLIQRHGQRIKNLSELADFKLFCLRPKRGRFVKGFARAYSLVGGSLAGELVTHMSDGHKKRSA